MPRINAFLQLARGQQCSDIHFSVGTPPLVRSLGDLTAVKYRDLSATELQDLLGEIVPAHLLDEFSSGNDIDFSYEDPEIGRFRANIFRKMGGLGATFRVIAPEIPCLAALGLPSACEKLMQSNHGLVLVTGTTGSGKSTTLAALIESLNVNRRLNIITLEDPIEYVYTSKLSLIVQREVGTHVTSFAKGIKDALREDPDVILVGELRDPESISLAMTAAETGHLVLSTLHTSSATKTLDRLIDAMPTEQKSQMGIFIAQNLRGVISQKLVRSFDRKSRKAIVELLVNNTAIANLILNHKIHQIPSILQTGSEKGMQLMDQALLVAVQKHAIDPDDAYTHALDKRLFQQYVTDPELLPQVELTVS